MNLKANQAPRLPEFERGRRGHRHFDENNMLTQRTARSMGGHSVGGALRLSSKSSASTATFNKLPSRRVRRMIGATNRRTKGDNLQHRQHRQRQQLAKKEERDKQRNEVLSSLLGAGAKSRQTARSVTTAAALTRLSTSPERTYRSRNAIAAAICRRMNALEAARWRDPRLPHELTARTTCTHHVRHLRGRSWPRPFLDRTIQ